MKNRGYGTRRTSFVTCLAISLSTAVSGLLPSNLEASTNEQWNLFRATVEQRCLEKVGSLFREATIWVDPFGTSALGLAIVSGYMAGEIDKQFVVCLMDKQTEALQSSSPAPVYQMLRPKSVE